MTRICGVCKLPPREGQEMRPIRLRESDLEVTGATEVGLYSACLECTEKHRERIAAEQMLKPADVSNHMLC